MYLTINVHMANLHRGNRAMNCLWTPGDLTNGRRTTLFGLVVYEAQQERDGIMDGLNQFRGEFNLSFYI